MKPAPSSVIPLSALREAVRQAVERRSMVAVAREVGMSAPGLRNFYDGGDPRQTTVVKLTEWYVREAASVGNVSASTVQAALSLLLHGIPARKRRAADASVKAALREAYEAAGVPVPKWLASGRKALKSDSADDSRSGAGQE